MNINLDALKNIKVEDLVSNLKEYFSSSRGLLKIKPLSLKLQ